MNKTLEQRALEKMYRIGLGYAQWPIKGVKAMMTREEYFDALKSFDWYYQMSDSGEVWARGDRSLRALRLEADQDTEKKKMFSEFAHFYNGTRSTEPTREEFDL